MSVQERQSISDTSSDTEKVSIPCDDTGRPTFNTTRTKQLLRKMDVNLIPFLALLYLLAFLDRSNVGNARLSGLEHDLSMDPKSLDYNIALTVFFPWYVFAEIPSNIVMKRTSPSLWLCVIMVVWGVIMMSMGFVKNYKSLLVARMALGLAEGGLFPGIAWYVTLWYRRHECGLRIAIFVSAATLAGAFGGLLARVISGMKGVAGRAGWSWIFILEGLATVIAGLFARWLVHDGPETAKFLTEEERIEIKARLKLDHDSLADEYHIKYVFAALKDWKIYVNMVIGIGMVIPLYSISLFLPTIVKNMGYTNNESQLMSVPPYFFGCISTVAGGYYADRMKQRGIFMILFCCMTILGLIFLISTHAPHVQYAGTFFVIAGVYPLAPMLVTWTGNNIGGSTKRAVCIAMQIAFGNLGGVVSAFVYRTKDSPRFFSGHGILIGVLSMSAILSLAMRQYFIRENARRDADMKAKGLTLETYTDDMKYEEREKGDYASFFRYTI